jgi:NADPH2:quinone reductase
MTAAHLKLSTEGTPGAIKAWVMEKSGTASNIALRFVEKPEPCDREVRVRVVAVATNPCDFKHCQADTYIPGAPFPAVIGSDVAGVVDALGKDAKRFKVGDRVHFFADAVVEWGGFGEYAVQNELRLAKIPDAMDFGTAAAIPCAAWTAYEVLFHRMKIEAGKTIYVAAGAGGVGSFAIQLAKNAGLKVVTTASGDNVERLRSEGYAVIDHKNEDFREAAKRATSGKGFDYALDVFGDKEAADIFSLLTVQGTYVHLSNIVQPTTDVFLKSLAVVWHIIGSYTTTEAGTAEFERMAESVNEDVLSGRLKIAITRGGFDGVRDALVAQEKGHVRGKQVLSLTNPPEAAFDAKFEF